ncbi:hypothetical protein MACH05_21500 [Qipengyuania nanhaisediminis]
MGDRHDLAAARIDQDNAHHAARGGIDIARIGARGSGKEGAGKKRKGKAETRNKRICQPA